MEKKSFGDILTDLRADAGLSLRSFCKKCDIDAGNWSRIEREVSKPPTDKAFYDKLQNILGFNDEVRVDIYAKARALRIVPEDLQDSGLMEHMPAMLRKASGEQLKDEEADKIVDWIRSTVTSENKDD